MHWSDKKITLPPVLKQRLSIDPLNNIYIFNEAGIKYYLTTAQFNDLKIYTRENRSDTVEQWYNSLDRIEKNKINHSGRNTAPELYNDGPPLD